MKFCQRQEKQGLGAALFAKVGEVLQPHGMKVGTGLANIYPVRKRLVS